MKLSNLSIAAFGDSHITNLIVPPNVAIIGRGGEKLTKSYESELVGYNVLVIMMGEAIHRQRILVCPPRQN